MPPLEAMALMEISGLFFSEMQSNTWARAPLVMALMSAEQVGEL